MKIRILCDESELKGQEEIQMVMDAAMAELVEKGFKGIITIEKS